MTSGRSARKRLKSRGDKTEPCDTPLSMRKHGGILDEDGDGEGDGDEDEDEVAASLPPPSDDGTGG